MTERDGDADLQRAGGRCEPAGMVPKVLWLLSRTFDNVGRPVCRVRAKGLFGPVRGARL